MFETLRFPRLLSCLVTCLLWPAWHGVAMAASEEEELASVFGDRATVSIAAGAPQPLRRAPAVASVITADDIAAMGATDLDDVLEAVPGIHVDRNTVAYAPLFTMRGVYSPQNPQVLMLLNGVPTTTLFTGGKGNAWGGLPLENVARIEIIRGPGSALYGADAYAGVINIITKTAAQQPGTQVGVRAGSFRSWDSWLLHGGQWGPLSLAAYLRVGSTDGQHRAIAADAQTRNDSLFGTHASRAPGPVHTGRDAVDASLDLAYEKLRFRAGLKLRDKLESGSGVGSALDPLGLGRSARLTTDLSWTDPVFARHWGVGMQASYFQYRDTIPAPFQLLPPGARVGLNAFPDGLLAAPEKWERQLRLSAFAIYSGLEGHRLRFGAGHDDLDLYKVEEHKNFRLSPAGVPIPVGSLISFTNTEPFMTPQRRRINYLALQDEWQLLPDWALTAGLRHDRYSDFGGTTNPRLALVWDARLDLVLKLLAGRAFRAPAFSELYSINNPVSRGNPALQPETIQTLEAAASWQARPDLQVAMNLFRYRMKQIIRLAGTPATYSNTSNQRGSGLELETAWQASRAMRLSANYSFQRSTDEACGSDAGYGPHHHLYAKAEWQRSNGLQYGLQFNHVADRRRAPGDTRPAVPDYSTLDATLRSHGASSRWTFAATMRNIFNADVRQPSLYSPVPPARGDLPTSQLPNDLPMPGRTLQLQASYQL